MAYERKAVEDLAQPTNMLITLYGINNIGKSTQAHLLVERLRAEGHAVEYVKYPIYELAPSGPFIHEQIKSGKGQNVSEEELQLWYTLNRFQFEPTLKAWLAEGKIVVAEDYIGTGLAWGMAKGADGEWLKTVNSSLLAPDFSILLDGERFTEAVEAGHAHETDAALMDRCRQTHLQLAKEQGWTVVPVVPGVEVVAENLWEVVNAFTLESCKNS